MAADTLNIVGEVLREVVDRTEGGMAGLLMGFDGLPVEHYVRDRSASVDVETVGAEYSVVLGQVRKAAEMLEAGTAREIAIQAEHLTTVIRLLNDDYFVAVTLKPHGNSGKARYLLRTSAERLLSALQ